MADEETKSSDVSENVSQDDDVTVISDTNLEKVEKSVIVASAKLEETEMQTAKVVNTIVELNKSDSNLENEESQKRKQDEESEDVPVAKIIKVEEEFAGEEKFVHIKEEKMLTKEDVLEGVHDAEKEMLELAGIAASASAQLMSESAMNPTNTASAEVIDNNSNTDSILGNLENIASSNPSGQVEIVVEQDAPVKSKQNLNIAPAEVQEATISNPVEVQQTNTATVAAPQGVNPAMMSNLLHTAAAVAAAQNVAAATVQVIPGQAAGTIQLVPASEVQRTQELMAAGMPPQNVNQSPEELAKNSQPVFSYLVTSQGTLIAAHASDGSELISGSSGSAKVIKRIGSGRSRKTGKHKNIVKKTEPGVDAMNRK